MPHFLSNDFFTQRGRSIRPRTPAGQSALHPIEEKVTRPGERIVSFAAIAIVLLLALLLGFPENFSGPYRGRDSLECPLEFHPATASGRLSVDALPWRLIRTTLVLPSEFFSDPLRFGASIPEHRARAEARAAIAAANQHLRALHLQIQIVSIEAFPERSNDPYLSATNARNPYDILATAAHRRQNLSLTESDLTLVLGRGYYAGNYGLAYPASSCIDDRNSVAFAAQGGGGAALEYRLPHTIAHEVGHFLGMSHAPVTTVNGTISGSLMSSHASLHPGGFSDESIAQATSRIAPGMSGGACFPADNSSSYPVDTDGDGVVNAVELQQGSDPRDAGSLSSKINGDAYTLWNTFLGVVNILEVTNHGEARQQIDLIVRGTDGSILKELTVALDPLQQFDFILNNIQGFPKDSYGTLQVRFQGEVDGRMSYYSVNELIGREFAYSVALSRPVRGSTTLGFNTLHAAGSLGAGVYQWLSLSNLENFPAQFRITTFDTQGSVLANRLVDVAANGRLDIDGGHGLGTDAKVGTHLILPASPEQRYLPTSTRYGVSRRSGRQFDFASPAAVQAGNGQATVIPVSAYDSENSLEDAWVEVTNSRGSSESAEILVFDNNGTLIHEQTVTLMPFGQYHFNASAILRSNNVEYGSAILSPHNPEAMHAQMLCYFRRKGDGHIASVFSSSMKESFDSAVAGSFNLFLDAKNELVVSNPYAFGVQFEITRRTASANAPVRHSIPAYGTRKIVIGPGEQIAAQRDSYGSISLKSAGGVPLLAEIRRLHDSSEGMTLAIPTLMR